MLLPHHVTRAMTCLLSGALIATLAGCGGDPTEQFLDSFRDDGAAVGFVVEGTVPDGVEAPEGLPADRPGRLGWILTRPEATDPGDLRGALPAGLATDPALLADLVQGVADMDAPLAGSASQRVLSMLGEQAPSVWATVAGSPLPAGGVDLDRHAVLETLAAAGAAPDADTLLFQQPFGDLVTDGVLGLLLPTVGDPAAWYAAVADAARTWIDPAVTTYGALARHLCSARPETAGCTRRLVLLTDDLRSIDQVLYETSPAELLPAPLSDDGTRAPLDDLNRDRWDRTLAQLGVDVPAALRARALA